MTFDELRLKLAAGTGAALPAQCFAQLDLRLWTGATLDDGMSALWHGHDSSQVDDDEVIEQLLWLARSSLAGVSCDDAGVRALLRLWRASRL